MQPLDQKLFDDPKLKGTPEELVKLAKAGAMNDEMYEAARKRTCKTLPFLSVGVMRTVSAAQKAVNADKGGFGEVMAELMMEMYMLAILTVYLLGYAHGKTGELEQDAPAQTGAA